MIASCAALLPFLAAAAAGFKRYHHDLRAIQFGEASVFKASFLICIGLAVALSVVGVVLGFNSAGQRRNSQHRKSWTGFFIGAGVLSLTIILFVAFRKLGFEVMAG